MDRLANLLNAAATAISDAQTDAMARYADLKPSTSAALLTLGQHQMITLSQLAAIVGISHSATVRLIDGLVQKGLVQRREGRDRREVFVALTVQGKAFYGRLRHAQAEVLTPLLAALSDGEREVLEAALSMMLARLTLGRGSADHICRFCDEDVCGQDHCPVEKQAVSLDRA